MPPVAFDDGTFNLRFQQQWVPLSMYRYPPEQQSAENQAPLRIGACSSWLQLTQPGMYSLERQESLRAEPEHPLNE